MTADLTGKIFALTCAVLWAFSIILFKRAVETIRPTALNFYKTFVAAVLMLPVLAIAEISLLPAGLSSHDWLIVCVSGILGIAVADSLLFKCLELLGAGLTGIVECLYSPMVILLSWIILSDLLNLHQIFGAGLVVAAVVVVTFKTKESSLPAKNLILGISAGALSMFSMALGIILMKPVFQRASFLWVTEIRMLASLPFLALFIFLKEKPEKVMASLRNPRNWKYAFPGSILGNLVAMTLWVAAFSLTDVSSAAILNQTNTIFIVIFAALILKEPFTVRRLLGTILAVSGSILVLVN